MNLNQQEKQTFILMMVFTFFNGFIMSIAQTQDIIAKKALEGLDWHITLLTMVWPIANFFSIWWGRALERTRDIAKFLIFAAVFGRLILVLVYWSVSIYDYLAILAIMYSFSSLILPAQNSIMQINIRPNNRGKVFGFVTSLATLLTIIITFTSGSLLEHREELFRSLFVIVGIAGFLGVLALALCNTKKKNVPQELISKRFSFVEPLKRAYYLLKEDKQFFKFQRNFFLYGIGFLILLPIIPKYLVDYLGMGYRTSFIAKGVVSQIGLLCLSPFFGKLFDKSHPTKFTSIGFAVFAIFPLLLLTSSFFEDTAAIAIVFLAYLFFGIGMSFINMSWNISSIYFAGNNDSSMYQSVHVTVTGLRGILTPVFGFIVMQLMGIRTVFAISIISLLTASLLNMKHYYSFSKKTFDWKKRTDKFKWYIRQLYPFR